MAEFPHVIGMALGSYYDSEGRPWCHACQQYVDPVSECSGPVEPPCHVCGGECEGRS